MLDSFNGLADEKVSFYEHVPKLKKMAQIIINRRNSIF